jgi:hypothetical protein
MQPIVILALLVFVSGVQAQQKMTQEGSANPHCEMMKRGEKGMGFSQETTTHHFRLLADGGAIDIQANDPKDAGTRDQIRQHLSHITKMFSDGNFEIPMSARRSVRWAERYEHIAASRARPRFGQVFQNGVADIST